MKENMVNISFSVSGYIVQDIVLATDDPLEAEELVRMLNAGEASGTIHEDNDVIMSDGAVIGTVRWSDTEVELANFRVEGGNSEEEAPEKKPFDAKHLALAGAIEEFVYEPDMSVEEIISRLERDMDKEPDLNIEANWFGRNGRQILAEIYMFAKGLESLMLVAHTAGKNGQEII